MNITMNETHKKRNNKNTPKNIKNNHNETQQAQLQNLDMETTNETNNQQANHTDTTMTWGNQLGPKNPHKIRFVLQNIGGIDMADNGLLKLAAL